MIVRIILLGILSGIIPFLLGMLYTLWINDDKNSIFKNWVSGFVLAFAAFQLLAVPFTYLGRSLTELAMSYALLLILGSACSLWMNRQRIMVILREMAANLRHTPWVTILALFVITFQIYMYVAYMHVDDDDSFYVATATTAVQTDSLFQFNPYSGAEYASFPSRYVLSPFPLFVAVLGRLFQIHTMIIAHLVLPVILVPLAYAVFAMVGYELFAKDRKKTASFVLFAAVIQMFAYTTTHTQGTVLLLRIWQGKAILASILLPLVFYLGARLIIKGFEKADWLCFVSLMLACCMVSSMGIMLGAIMTGIIGILAAFCKKSIRVPAKLLLCCIPNLLFAGIYILIR